MVVLRIVQGRRSEFCELGVCERVSSWAFSKDAKEFKVLYVNAQEREPFTATDPTINRCLSSKACHLHLLSSSSPSSTTTTTARAHHQHRPQSINQRSHRPSRVGLRFLDRHLRPTSSRLAGLPPPHHASPSSLSARLPSHRHLELSSTALGNHLTYIKRQCRCVEVDISGLEETQTPSPNWARSQHGTRPQNTRAWNQR